MEHPLVIQKKEIITSWIKKQKCKGKTVGFIPTMGALHDAHLSLVKTAQELCDITVVSIYVNPTQFGPGEDFDAYPRVLDDDLEKLYRLNVDMVFAPDNHIMYSGNPLTKVQVDLLTETLCGAKRPGHFNGVTLVVAKLFNIVQPDMAFFGKKDFQQYVTIKKMVEDLDFPVKIIGCDIVREHDGLAMSSRNRYLSKKERKNAPAIYKALLKGKANSSSKTPAEIIRQISTDIEISGGKIDYVQCVNSTDLQPVLSFEKEVLIAVAVFYGTTRLIDNIIIKPQKI